MISRTWIWIPEHSIFYLRITNMFTVFLPKSYLTFRCLWLGSYFLPVQIVFCGMNLGSVPLSALWPKGRGQCFFHQIISVGWKADGFPGMEHRWFTKTLPDLRFLLSIFLVENKVAEVIKKWRILICTPRHANSFNIFKLCVCDVKHLTPQLSVYFEGGNKNQNMISLYIW